jgi:hypothetical protein
MITVAMGGDDCLQWLPGEQSKKSIMIIGRVDQHTRAVLGLKQVGVVVHRTDT